MSCLHAGRARGRFLIDRLMDLPVEFFCGQWNFDAASPQGTWEQWILSNCALMELTWWPWDHSSPYLSNDRAISYLIRLVAMKSLFVCFLPLSLRASLWDGFDNLGRRQLSRASSVPSHNPTDKWTTAWLRIVGGLLHTLAWRMQTCISWLQEIQSLDDEFVVFAVWK